MWGIPNGCCVSCESSFQWLISKVWSSLRRSFTSCLGFIECLFVFSFSNVQLFYSLCFSDNGTRCERWKERAKTWVWKAKLLKLAVGSELFSAARGQVEELLLGLLSLPFAPCKQDNCESAQPTLQDRKVSHCPLDKTLKIHQSLYLAVAHWITNIILFDCTPPSPPTWVFVVAPEAKRTTQSLTWVWWDPWPAREQQTGGNKHSLVLDNASLNWATDVAYVGIIREWWASLLGWIWAREIKLTQARFVYTANM